MEINNIKINAFGNIENKEITLSDGINIIYGKNESGKSTLLKFITNMFYGTSKNKKGREISDYERYKPWEKEEFSGKIKYTLDNGKQFEIFRDFNKKNPKIYNENAEEISKEFNIDKTNGNEFFIEQTKIDEATFLSSLVSMQQEVKLDKNEQNNLIQKIANIVGTGDDNISYRKALEKINKKQVEEIGTARTQGRPINIIKEEKYKLQDEIGELEEYKNKKYELDEIKQNIEKETIKNENKLKYIKEIKQLKEKEKIEKQKIELNKNIIESNNKKIAKLKLEQKEIKEELKKQKVIENKTRNLVYIVALIILIALIVIFNSNIILLGIITTLVLVDVLIITYKLINNRKKHKNTEKKNRTQIKEIEKINTEINIIEKNNEEQEKQIKDSNTSLNHKYMEIRNEIDNRYKYIEGKENLINNILYKMEELQNLINKNKLQIHTIEIDKKSVIDKLEKLSQIEEKIEKLKEKEQNLEKLNNSIELVKEILEESYNKMKENVSPRFTQNLSKNISKISNEKYKNVRVNDEEGLIIEKYNGEYISAEKLSIGTIDQLYMSLRFASIKEISEENMPIILDESFAYYDDERLKNILKYLNEEFKNQIIIFTCTNREKEILEKENIKYNCNIM